MVLPSPSMAAPGGRVTTLSLLHLRFYFRVEVDKYLPPIWEAVSWIKVRTEGLAAINQTLMRGIPSYCQVFRGGVHFIASLPLFALVLNVSLCNLSLYPSCYGGSFTPWLMRQGTAEASTHGGADASLLAQHLDGRLALVDSLQTNVRVRLENILSVDEALCHLGTFAFVASHLFRGWKAIVSHQRAPPPH